MKLLNNISTLTSWFSTEDFPDPTIPKETKPISTKATQEVNQYAELKEKLALEGYNKSIEELREKEYPQLKDSTYLDHAGTTLYCSSLIRRISSDLMSNLYGNPHSQSPSSQLTTRRIRDIRLQVLRLFNASPEDYDVVFTANATAGIKLVLETFNSQGVSYDFRYHKDCHTSVLGVRGNSASSTCFQSDEEVEQWLDEDQGSSESDFSDDDISHLGLFAYPAQSNFSGRRLPRAWCKKLREGREEYFSLLDAAALVTTGVLDLDDIAPDFTVVSFYKMFGYPDLGALIVRKATPGMSEFLESRRYFGGGTVAAVVASDDQFHAKRTGVPHEHMEDGSLPFHSIIALDAAMRTHQELYGSFADISKHTGSLTRYLRDRLVAMEHWNQRKLCTLYSESYDPTSRISIEQWTAKQGPIICFNMQRASGSWIGYSEVEKLASVRNIHIRTGGLCNPGGVESYVGLQAWEVKKNYEAGHRCWDDQDVIRDKPTGAIRVSLGAMSTIEDVLQFVDFVEEFYLEKEKPITAGRKGIRGSWGGRASAMVESITIYPIKSCGGFKIPKGYSWELKPHGLAWDREWCLVHLGTGAAMNQKQYNRMALLRPTISIESGELIVSTASDPNSILSIPLASDIPDLTESASRVCGDKITALTYNAPEIIEFFTAAVGVPCTLARFPASLSSQRHFKSHLSLDPLTADSCPSKALVPILLSNESPLLVINRASLDALNTTISTHSTSKDRDIPITAPVFRANIVVSPTSTSQLNPASAPYSEDAWEKLQIGHETIKLLGGCRRCRMVNIDQETAEKREEPYVTLSKTRTVGGRVLFGVHAAWEEKGDGVVGKIKVGDLVRVWEKPAGENEEEMTMTGGV